MDAEIIERVQNFRLMDDIFFNAFMQDYPEGMEYVLNVIMGRDDLKVIRLETQMEIPGIIARGVRFDVFVTDSQGREYDFEVQNGSEGADPRRLRYNGSMMDYMHMKRGADWQELPDVYVIMLCDFDKYGCGAPLYHVENIVREARCPFGDGKEIIYVNGTYRDLGTALGRLIADFHCSNPQDMDAEVLRSRAKFLKSDGEGVTKMCKSVEEYAERKAAEREEKSAVKIIKNLMRNLNVTAEKAMEAAGIPQADFGKYMALL